MTGLPLTLELPHRAGRKRPPRAYLYSLGEITLNCFEFQGRGLSPPDEAHGCISCLLNQSFMTIYYVSSPVTGAEASRDAPDAVSMELTHGQV